MNSNTPKRSEIRIGSRVQIIEKQNQPTGELTEGVVARLLTKSPTHPHGIKVVLTGGKSWQSTGDIILTEIKSKQPVNFFTGCIF